MAAKKKKPAKKKPVKKQPVKKAQSKKPSTRKTKAKSGPARAGKTSASRSKTKKTKSNLRLLQPLLIFFIGVLFLLFTLWVAYLDFEVRNKFEGKRWAIPAKVYSRPLEVYAGLNILPEDLIKELELLHYERKQSESMLEAGDYSIQQISPREVEISVKTRGFRFTDGEQASQDLVLHVKDRYITASSHAIGRLEPQLIGGIYPSHNEDRVLIQLEQTPPFLIETLVMVEDREFFNHYGVSPKGILRAAIINVFSGEVRQGGSTLTQQLVKNFYLSNERTIIRKLNEAMMALLLESHYSKNEILEAYLNEVNLGQIGKRGIHGFGLAAQHYYGQEIENLDLHQIALLVALVKGPSYYSPRRNPERALKRRNLVIDVMVEHGFVSAETGRQYKSKDLDLTEESSLKHKQYPAFLQLVKQQLKQDYSSDDLQSEGLRIFTSFDPVLQEKAERSVTEVIGGLRSSQVPMLQGAFIVIEPQSAEVLALVAGADLRSAGFNRVLDARRSIGSLAKPAVYLSALRSKRYHWASEIDDSEVYVDKYGNIGEAPADNLNGDIWAPKNFDKKVHGVDGKVSLIEAMSQSYNQATVRLGMETGLKEVIKTFRDLGLEKKPEPFPSILLGTIELSPFQVTELFQTVASSGFNTPVRAIREVQDAHGQALSRYPFELEQKLDSKSAYLIFSGMQQVVKTGTAKSLNRYVSPELGIAGKTGTSNDQRDSWFVGFGGNILATAWVGNDDNSPTPYTGASAALKIWTHFAINYPIQANSTAMPDGIRWVWIDVSNQKLADESCERAVFVPVLEELIPEQESACAGGKSKGLKHLFGF